MPGPPTAGPASPGRAGRAGRPLARPRSALGSVANATRRSGRSVDVRDAATARSRWRGSRRRAGTPACGRSSAIRAASIAASKQSAGERGATIGTGASPLRPNIACSRSACSVLVGSPVDGPPRWMSTMISGSSSDTARPIVSALSATPGPGGRGDAERRRRTTRPSAAPTAGDLVLGLERAHAEPLVLAQLVQDVRGRGDRVGAEEQRQPGALRGGDQAVGQREVAGDVAVGARRAAGPA